MRKVSQAELLAAMENSGRNTCAPYLWDGMILFYPFVRGKNDPRDFSGEQWDIHDTTATWAPGIGPWAYGMHFASGQLFKIPRVDDSKYLSVSWWCQPVKTGELWPTFFSSYSSSSNYAWWYYYADSNDNRIAYQYKYSGSAKTLISNTTLSYDKPDHIVITYDGLTGISHLYFNGVLDHTTTLHVATPRSFNEAGVQHGARFYDGMLYEMRKYNRVLSPTEAEELYTAPWNSVIARPTQVFIPHGIPPISSNFPMPLFSGAV